MNRFNRPPPEAYRTRLFKMGGVRALEPAKGSTAKTWRFVASDGDFDRVQDRLSVKGWNLEAYNKNPVLLLNHDAGDGGWLGLGKKDVLPIGKGRAFVQGSALMVDLEFDQSDDLSRRVESKVAGGFIGAVSVRYLMTGGYRENERGGIDSDEQELLEISLVTIPCNPRAVRAKAYAAGRAAPAKGVDLNAAAHEIAVEVRKQLAIEALVKPIAGEVLKQIEAEQAHEARLQRGIAAAFPPSAGEKARARSEAREAARAARGRSHPPLFGV